MKRRCKNLDARIFGIEREGRKEGERLSKEMYDRIDWRSVGGPRRRALASNLFPAAAASSRLMSLYARVEFFSSGLPFRDSYVPILFSNRPLLCYYQHVTCNEKNELPRIVYCYYIATITHFWNIFNKYTKEIWLILKKSDIIHDIE